MKTVDSIHKIVDSGSKDVPLGEETALQIQDCVLSNDFEVSENEKKTIQGLLKDRQFIPEAKNILAQLLKRSKEGYFANLKRSILARDPSLNLESEQVNMLSRFVHDNRGIRSIYNHLVKETLEKDSREYEPENWNPIDLKQQVLEILGYRRVYLENLRSLSVYLSGQAGDYQDSDNVTLFLQAADLSEAVLKKQQALPAPEAIPPDNAAFDFALSEKLYSLTKNSPSHKIEVDQIPTIERWVLSGNLAASESQMSALKSALDKKMFSEKSIPLVKNLIQSLSSGGRLYRLKSLVMKDSGIGQIDLSDEDRRNLRQFLSVNWLGLGMFEPQVLESSITTANNNPAYFEKFTDKELISWAKKIIETRDFHLQRVLDNFRAYFGKEPDDSFKELDLYGLAEWDITLSRKMIFGAKAKLKTLTPGAEGK